MQDFDKIENLLRPTDVKIFTENGKNYLDYTGVMQYDGNEIIFHLPKIDLTICEINIEGHDASIELRVFPDNSNNLFTLIEQGEAI